MFNKTIYTTRRDELLRAVNNGIIFIPGNEESPMNYAANPYHFRQDSTFLYYLGLDLPGLACIMDADNNETIIFGEDPGIDDIIWMGPQTLLKEQAAAVGVSKVEPAIKLSEYLEDARNRGRKIHLLPPYREQHISLIGTSLGLPRDQVSDSGSAKLIKAVIAQRSVKGPEEIEELIKAQAIAYEMHTTAMQMAKAGVYEHEISGYIEGITLAAGGNVAFPVILSKRGEILHNHYHGNLLSDGDLVINDSGAENKMHYASDITRTFPVSGEFTSRQKEIYQIVLDSQVKAIEATKPGIKNQTLHLQTAKVISEGLKDLGIMKGDPDEAVNQGAHALFFPHGLGHMLGLDVHDMENLGEDLVGYDENTRRSDQFGLAYLRLGKELQAGYVFTIEPGIYFIPELIKKWKSEKKFEAFINYAKVEEYLDFGGIRIEDDILVTENGYEVIGKPIPKTIVKVEQMCQS